jgi:hypothetical protein
VEPLADLVGLVVPTPSLRPCDDDARRGDTDGARETGELQPGPW